MDAIKALLLTLLPHHALSHLMHKLTRLRSKPLKNAIIRRLVRQYDINTDEAQLPVPDGFDSVNAFFTRELKPGVRPLPPHPDTISSPADGRVSEAGKIQAGQVFQAKGHRFSVADLLGDPNLARQFDQGSFITLYLSPRDYHRVHMPVNARLLGMRHIPGRLFSVAPALVRSVPRLFARNERVVTIWQADHGLVAQVLVGAIFVGSIETVWAGEITPPAGKKIHFTDYSDATTPDIEIARGDEMGRFNMGSTVITLFADPDYQLMPQLTHGYPLKVGEQMGCYEAGRS